MPGVPAFSGGFSVVSVISCAKAGFCTAGGGYDDSHGYFHGFAVTETNGVWHKAFSFPKNTEVDSISCPTVGFCTIGGSYDGGCPCQAFVVSQKKGVWGKVQIVPGCEGDRQRPRRPLGGDLHLLRGGYILLGGRLLRSRRR